MRTGKIEARELKSMLTHFQFKPLYENKQLPGWKFTFYYNKEKIHGLYHQNGKIEWIVRTPSEEDEIKLIEQIHELMLFHVYDQ